MRTKHYKGFTLMEALVAVAIISLVIVAIGAFQQNIFSLNRIISSSLTSQYELSHLINPLANEIRSATVSDAGDYPLGQTATSSLIFFTDINNDGNAEKIRYFLDGKDFKKGTTASSGNPPVYNPANEKIIQVVHNVLATSTAIFTYYDSSYDGASSTSPLPTPVSPSNVTLIKVEVSTDDDVNKPPAPAVISTIVTVRNLADDI